MDKPEKKYLTIWIGDDLFLAKRRTELSCDCLTRVQLGFGKERRQWLGPCCGQWLSEVDIALRFRGNPDGT